MIQAIMPVQSGHLSRSDNASSETAKAGLGFEDMLPDGRESEGEDFAIKGRSTDQNAPTEQDQIESDTSVEGVEVNDTVPVKMNVIVPSDRGVPPLGRASPEGPMHVSTDPVPDSGSIIASNVQNDVQRADLDEAGAVMTLQDAPQARAGVAALTGEIAQTETRTGDNAPVSKAAIQIKAPEREGSIKSEGTARFDAAALAGVAVPTVPAEPVDGKADPAIVIDDRSYRADQPALMDAKDVQAVPEIIVQISPDTQSPGAVVNAPVPAAPGSNLTARAVSVKGQSAPQQSTVMPMAKERAASPQILASTANREIDEVQITSSTPASSAIASSDTQGEDGVDVVAAVRLGAQPAVNFAATQNVKASPDAQISADPVQAVQAGVQSAAPADIAPVRADVKFDQQIPDIKQVDAPLPKSPIARNIAERIAHIPIQAGSFTIRLNPHGMGLVDIAIERLSDGRMNVSMHAQNPLVLEAMVSDRAAISHLFVPPAGSQSGTLSMSLMQFGQGADTGTDAQGQGSRKDTGSRGNDGPHDALSGDAEAGSTNIISSEELNILT